MLASFQASHWFFYSVFFALLALLWLFLQPVVLAVIVSALLATIAYPLFSAINTHIYTNKPSVAALCTVLVSLLVIVFPLLGIFSLLVSEALSLYRTVSIDGFFLEGHLKHFELLLSQHIPDISLNIQSILSVISQWLALQLGAIFSSSLIFLLNLVIMLFTTFYLLRDGPAFLQWLIRVSPLPDQEDSFIISRTRQAVISIVRGLFSVAILQGLVVTLGFWLFGIPNPILWGSVTAIFAFIPGLGTPLIILPAVAYLYFTGHVFGAVGLLIWGAIAVIVIENIISPALMSYGQSLHPLLILLSVIGGISLLGMIGVLLGPILMSIIVTMFDLLQKRQAQLVELPSKPKRQVVKKADKKVSVKKKVAVSKKVLAKGLKNL